MSKHKGKSRRRIQNLQSRYDQDEDISAVEQHSKSKRAVKLPAARLAEPELNLEELPKATGLVVSQLPRGAIVRIAGHEYLCAIAKTFRAPPGATPLAVGDEVTVATTEHPDEASLGDKDRIDGFVIARQPRGSTLSRPRPLSGKRRGAYDSETFEKVMVANVDLLLIVAASRQPALRLGLIDRFMIIAQRGELTPLLVINKIDLGRPEPAEIAHVEQLGMEKIFCSAATGEGVAQLVARLAGHRSVLAGASGVGKSTLINILIPGATAATREIRTKDMRGRHRTTAALVYDLPGGGIVVDTPGIRELGIHLSAAELPWYFPEFEALGGQCHFNNCTHTHEPDCAVVAAVEAGTIPAARYESYLRILETLDD